MASLAAKENGCQGRGNARPAAVSILDSNFSTRLDGRRAMNGIFRAERAANEKVSFRHCEE